MNVNGQVRAEANEIGDLASLDSSAAIKLSHELSSLARGGLESGKGR